MQASPSDLVADLTRNYVELHETKEDLFWSVYMGLAPDAGAARAALSDAEKRLNAFLQDPGRLGELRDLERNVHDERLRTVLRGWVATLRANTLESEEARRLSAEIVERESALANARSTMTLGYTDPESGTFVAASSVKLRLLQRASESEAMRKAAFEGLRSIEPFVLDHDFLEIVKLRNKLARSLGFEDYYDWRVAVTEGIRKRDVFGLLGNLLEATRERAAESLARFRDKHGANALEPWNIDYFARGSLDRETDRYFPFGEAVDRWVHSFQALGIRFRGAHLTLDLIDRPGKYENGFMHGPGLAWYDETGAWHPARINFSANAVPDAVGGGLRALTTLFHEGGHAAHFSNIVGESPCFSHEFAPTSVAYAETQSMFLDSLLEDPSWRLRYARDRDGEAMPESLAFDSLREAQLLRAFNVRSMMTIPFAERAIYEIPDDELTKDRVLDTIREVERETQTLSAGVRPVLSVPHLLAGESSAYYHGYVLAEMAVYQTRDFFLRRDGYLTDNSRIGPDLAQHYWAPGNRVRFDDTLRALTGDRLSADALASACNATADEVIDAAREAHARTPERAGQEEVNLDASLRIIHGCETIADVAPRELGQAADEFRSWVEAHYPVAS